MKLTFYYSFSEFKENYDLEFQRWSEVYNEGNRKDFLLELREMYSMFINIWDGRNVFDGNFEIQAMEDDYPKNQILSMDEYYKIVNHMIGILLLRKGLDKKDVDYLEYYDFYDHEEDLNTVFVDKVRHEIVRPFFQRGIFGGIEVDEIKYRNFGYSVVKIFDFIENELVTIANENQQVKTPQIENNNNNNNNETVEITPFEKEKGQNVPYKIAMLEKLGVLEHLNSRYPNETDRIKVIHYLTGGNEDNVKKYYQSIFGNYSGTLQIAEKHREHANKIYFK